MLNSIDEIETNKEIYVGESINNIREGRGL